jgi:hypothetical protein
MTLVPDHSLTEDSQWLIQPCTPPFSDNHLC